MPLTRLSSRNPYAGSTTATSISNLSFVPIELAPDGDNVVCKLKFHLKNFSKDELGAVNVDFAITKNHQPVFSKALHLTSFPEGGSYSRTDLPNSVAHMEVKLNIPKGALLRADHYTAELTGVDEANGVDLHNPGHWFSFIILRSPQEIEAKIKADPSLATETDRESGSSGILFACTHNSPALIDVFLAHGANLLSKDRAGTTTLHMATKSISVMKELLKKGVPVDIQDNEGYTPLMAAAVGGSPKDIACLVEHGANVNHQAKDGQTALMQAVEWNDGFAARHLIADGARLEAFDKHHITALHIAAESNNIKMIDMLVKAGAKVDWVHPEDKFTALDIAAKAGAPDSIKELLRLGANPNALTVNHHTALDLAVHYEHEKAADLLKPLTTYAVNTDWDHDPRMKNASAEDYQRLTGQ
jgi:ankyrin repeat protein